MIIRSFGALGNDIFFIASAWFLLDSQFGYSYIALWILLFAITLFLVSSLIALLYSITIQRLTKKLSIRISSMYDNNSNKLFKKLEKIN